MLSDIEIINSSTMKEIRELTGRYGINDDELYAYGKYIAKAEFELLKRVENRPDGKLILVTAITPTPAGEGKSTITIGLVDVLNRLGKKVLGCIREPSLGPVFGVKGGAAGGGYAQVNPMVDLNLHFTGDIHAITTANNLVSACIDNHLYQGNELGIDPKRITWKRCLDLNDRALRKVTVGLDSKKEVPRPDYFNISVASEIMAILCLAHDYADLRERLDRTLIAYDFSGKPIAIKDLGITGSLMVLLKQALKPNFIQTLENNLMLVHGGPFANIAHGCNSVIASRLALKLADYVVTEAGFGADLGAEKFLDIKCQEEGLNPNLVVVVATIRALKYHGGVSVKNLNQENLEALKVGVKNLERHLQTVRTFELPAVVALNRFASDSEAEIEFMKEWAKANNVLLSLADVFSQGSQGGLELGKAVLSNLKDLKYKPIYKTEEDLFQKIEKICYKVYGASAVEYAPEALSELKRINQDEAYRNFYICMAKTPNSITDNPKIYGVPDNHTISIKEVRLSTGPKFVICLTGTIMTMPGLSKKPMATKITMTDDGTISGIM
ncbi:MAG TPA: formate--tetrahydrofolate ligase [Acholeplasmataceae bacterium]|jgi:formate--tetrahydrofolate ligase|nr:formate--tetrahydrofolate ligase [Acholeplasmataceae bacterium]